uniref:Uncharacterized protein n=1 Tax=Lepeophtheirus salmonis TaxID=72036 RepID=A0A0K2UIJ7_LEPSM
MIDLSSLWREENKTTLTGSMTVFLLRFALLQDTNLFRSILPLFLYFHDMLVLISFKTLTQ